MAKKKNTRLLINDDIYNPADGKGYRLQITRLDDEGTRLDYALYVQHEDSFGTEYWEKIDETADYEDFPTTLVRVLSYLLFESRGINLGMGDLEK